MWIIDPVRGVFGYTSIRPAVKCGCGRRPEARGLERELVAPLAVQSLELLPRGNVVTVERGGQVQPEQALVPRPRKDKRTELQCAVTDGMGAEDGGKGTVPPGRNQGVGLGLQLVGPQQASAEHGHTMVYIHRSLGLPECDVGCPDLAEEADHGVNVLVARGPQRVQRQLVPAHMHMCTREREMES